MLNHISDALNTALPLDRVAMHIVVTIATWAATIIAIFVDLWDALYTARKIKEPWKSHKLRHTTQKIGEYWRAMLIGFLFDSLCMFIPWYNFSYLTILIGIALLIVEASSLREHAKKRKSKLQELPDIITSIISCADEKEALSLIKKIKNTVDTKNENNK